MVAVIFTFLRTFHLSKHYEVKIAILNFTILLAFVNGVWEWCVCVCVPQLFLVSQKHPCDSNTLFLILFSLHGPCMHSYEVILPMSREFSSIVPQLTCFSLLFVPHKDHSHLICTPLCILFLLHNIISVDALISYGL